MNTQTSPSSVALEPINPRRSGAVDPYASEEQTTVLLRRGAEYRRQRINASDMITTDEAAELSGTSRVTINAWIKSGRCIGVTHLRRGFKIPKWQFEPYVFPVIQALSEALGTSDGWQMLSFLETPHEALDGLAPRIALERGVPGQRIVDLATAEGH
jgi:excisionase family DNA binding protein